MGKGSSAGEPGVELDRDGMSRHDARSKPYGLRLSTRRCAEAVYPGALAFAWTPALAVVYPTIVVNGCRVLPLSRTWRSLANGTRSATLLKRTV
jgi:hypothetical protein